MSELLERYDDIVKRALRTGRLENILFARIIRRKIKMKHNITLETVNSFEQYKKALNAYAQAVQDFNRADHEHIDIAIIQLDFAEKKLDFLRRSLEKEKELSAEAQVLPENYSFWLNCTQLGQKMQNIFCRKEKENANLE
jgi:hypothetical protein